MRIEFFLDDDGSTLMVRSDDTLSIWKEKHPLTNTIWNAIKVNYPTAFDAMLELYSRAYNYKYLMVRRFLKCNLGKNDHIIDFDGTSFNLELISCPLRGECKHEGIICKPKFNSRLTRSEEAILRLIAQHKTDKEIADELFNSPLTIETHRKHILKKLGLKNKGQLIAYYIKNFNDDENLHRR